MFHIPLSAGNVYSDLNRLYTIGMSTPRRIVSIFGLLLLAVSLLLLAASLWPASRHVERQNLPPDDLALPTPQSFVPLYFVGAVVSSRRASGRRRAPSLILFLPLSLFLFSCGAAASTAAPPPERTREPTAEPASTQPSEPAYTEAPTLEPASTQAPTLEPATAVAPRPPEPRAVELDYPLTLVAGSSDVIRLALVVTSAGTYVTPTAQGGNNVAIGEPVKIPNLYDTHTVIAVARLDAVALKMDRAGDWEQPLAPGESVAWRWTVAADPAQTGRQRANLTVRLRFIPKAGGETLERELWARTIVIQTRTVLGLSSSTASVFGVAGSVFGALLGFPFADKIYVWLWNTIKARVRRKK